MAKEHQFLFNLKKNDLAIVRNYAANMLDYKSNRVMDSGEIVFLLNCISNNGLDDISAALKKESRKNTKSEKASYHSPHIRRRAYLNYRDVCVNIADKIVDAEANEYTKILNIMKSFFNKQQAKTTAIHPKVKKLAKIYPLNKVEQMIVTALYYITMLDCKSIFMGDAKEIICMFTGIDYKEFEKCTHKKSNLVYYELARDNDLDALNDTVIQYLSDEENRSFLDFLCTKEYSEYDIDSYFLDENTIETAKAVMEKVDNAKILLYGASGTGKTSFAKSLAEYCGKTPYSLDDNDTLWLASHSISENEVLIIDEADNLFNEGLFDFMRDAKKSEMNKQLDSIDSQCIFLANTIKRVDKSVLRRFNYIVEFKELSISENEQIWRKNIDKIDKILSDNEVTEYAHKYPLPIGIVSMAVDTALKVSKKKEKRKKVFEEIMKSHNKVRNGKVRKMHPKVNFDTSFLNTDVSVDTIKSYINQYTKMQNKDIRCGLLFHGVPGTGKTEFARYLAELSGYEHTTMRVSDFLSPYVGETEQNIAKAFKKAEEKNMVLIFDEADSLLLDRKGASKNWEITQVNEFLAQLDSYKGIFIATTNYVKNFDMAAMRRFDWKVEFNAIESSKIYNAFCHFFPNVDFSRYKDKMKSFKNITAGDIAVLTSKFKFEKKILAEKVIEQAEIELKYKENHTQKSVGF